MRKSIPLVAIAVVLLASSLALPAERDADRGNGDGVRFRAAAAAAPAAPTLHRLLRGRLQWTLQLTRALRMLEEAPEPQPIYGIRTIIDDPDPAGVDKGGSLPPPPEEDEPEEGTPVPEQQDDSLNDGSTRLQEFG